MIHILTFGNFDLLDARIEDAYRRRRSAPQCTCGQALRDDLVPCDMRERFRDRTDWLRQLASDMETLAQAANLSPPRRGRASRTISANAKSPRQTRGSKGARQKARAG